MIVFLSAVFAAPLAGIALAVVWWAIRGRLAALTGAAAGFAAAAGLLAVLTDLGLRVHGAAPVLFGAPPSPDATVWLLDNRFLIPLVVGIVGLGILAFPISHRVGTGSADLTPRSPVSFARGWWFAVPAIALALTVAVALAAGAASERSADTGRYDQYTVDAGAMTVAVHIYGWYYSVPALIALAVIVLLVCVDLVLIARPPLAEDRDRDARERRVRTRNVLAAATGAVLLHLGIVLSSLSGTASMRGGMATPGGEMAMWSPMAALEPFFAISGHVATACGVALWATVALSAIPARRHAPVLAAA